MTQVSKYPLSKDVYERVFDVFLKTIVGLRTKKEVTKFLEEFLSPTEQIMLAKRLSIALLLEKNYDYRQIARILRVSTATVASVVLAYRYGDEFKGIIRRILQDEKMEEFWTNVGTNVTNALSLSGSKSGTWIYLRNELKKKRRKKKSPF